MSKVIKSGFINGKEYAGFVTPIGDQFMASVVSAGEVKEAEHHTKILPTYEEAEKAIHDLWNELEKASN